MYILPEFVDTAMENNGLEWKTPTHRVVAVNLLTCNPRITTMDDLMNLAKKINEIPEDKIKSFTLHDAVDLGVPVN